MKIIVKLTLSALVLAASWYFAWFIVPILVALLLVSVLIYFAAPWLADESILFTKVQEGTVKAIMRGDSVDRFVMSFAGYHMNDPRCKKFDPSGGADWEVLPHPRGKDDEFDERSWLLKHLGLYWVGMPWRNKVYIYQFEWNETRTRDDGKEEVYPRKEFTDFIFVSDFTYAILTDGADTKDKLMTDELTLVTVAIRNPYKALFSGEDWMRRITSAINRNVKEFVGQRTFEEMITVSRTVPTEFSKPIIDLTDKLPDDSASPPQGLKGRYGIVIQTADLQIFDLAGGQRQKNEEAAAAIFAATQARQAAILKAEGEAEAIKLKGKAEAEALDGRLEVIKKHGEEGITLAGYDAIQETSKGPGTKIIWANNPLSALKDILKGNRP